MAIEGNRSTLEDLEHGKKTEGGILQVYAKEKNHSHSRPKGLMGLALNNDRFFFYKIIV